MIDDMSENCDPMRSMDIKWEIDNRGSYGWFIAKAFCIRRTVMMEEEFLYSLPPCTPFQQCSIDYIFLFHMIPS